MVMPCNRIDGEKKWKILFIIKSVTEVADPAKIADQSRWRALDAISAQDPNMAS